MSWRRAGYTALVWAAMPWAALYLLWRSIRQPEYRKHWGERFGWARYADRDGRPLVWVHAVSLGETRAAQPLLEALLDQFPDHVFLLTHMTPTGRAAGAAFASRWPNRIAQVYLPYDMPFAVRRFQGHFRPRVGIGMETETWPNLLAAAHDSALPLVLVNARLSEKSFAKSRLAAGLFLEAAQCFTEVLAQTDADARRLQVVGARKVEVVGNLKFDLAPDATLVGRGRAAKRATRGAPVLIFAVTRDGEEAQLLEALRTQSERLASVAARLIFVPRHPQRFDDVARLCETAGFAVSRRSRFDDLRTWFASAGRAGVLLGDSMGEMPMYYAAADVAFVGGSLLPLGGQNLIEACMIGTPVVIGQHTFNFAQAADDAVAAGAAVRVTTASAAVTAMLDLVGDPARLEEMSRAASRFAAQHRGATARTVERLIPIICAAA